MTSGGPRQVIPRPPDVRLGGPAPWAAVPPMERRIDAATLRRVFGGRRGRPIELAPVPESLPAAVLAAFYEASPSETGDLEVVLTRRSMAMRSHTGEVSFPGGRADVGEDPVRTALREAHEEIGLDPSRVEVLGELDHFVTLTSRSFIVPVVALLDRRPSLRPSAHEVDEILRVPVRDLMADGVYREERWRFSSPTWLSSPSEPVSGASAVGERPIYFFELPTDTVWGATANMLRDLLCLALDLSDPPGP
jgi:8-oxo-dGTP pyrophosphatase MutT (NUDIX family)